jgi:hypothetical protein
LEGQGGGGAGRGAVSGLEIDDPHPFSKMASPPAFGAGSRPGISLKTESERLRTTKNGDTASIPVRLAFSAPVFQGFRMQHDHDDIGFVSAPSLRGMLSSAALSMAMSLVFLGCGDESTAPHSGKDFSDAQRSACPESPFKPEFPVAPKVSASARVIAYHVEIYTTRGKFINEWSGEYDPEVRDPRTGGSSMFLWDGRDASGKEVESGYYFFQVEMSNPGSTVTEKRSTCVFWLNQIDTDKLK